MGKSGDLTGAAEPCAALQREMDELRAALGELRKDLL
jgi:hypothetical protein